MEDGAGPRTETTPGSSVLYSQALRSLMGGECLQILRCSICMEFFNIPIVLPCGHTFCLQCLTEMCRHATRSRTQNPLKDLLIGCPNCRVQIFAKPILERNVTCNFIIQSLIDMLRNKRIPVTHEACVNTERSVVGAPVRAVSQEVLCGVLRDVDRLSNALASRSIVDDAFFEIESLRRQYASSNLARTSSSVDPRGSASTPVASSSANLTVPGRTSVNSALNPLSGIPGGYAGATKQVQHPRKAYATAVSSQPQQRFSMSRANLPSAQPNQCRPGFRNKNRNNVDVAGGSPPEVSTTGDGAHCIAKIFPEVTSGVKRRHSNFRPPPKLRVEESLQGCSCPSETTNGANRGSRCSAVNSVHSDEEGNQSPPSIALNYRLARKRTETHSGGTRPSPVQTEEERSSAEASWNDSQRSPKKARSPEACAVATNSKDPKSVKENLRLRSRKSRSRKRCVRGSTDCYSPECEVARGLTALFDSCSDVLEAKDTKDEAEGEARASPLAAMFLNLSVEAREC